MVTLPRLTHAIRLGFRGLAAHRLRTFLTALGIILGVASVIIMLAVGEAAKEQALRQLRDLGANTIVLSTTKPQEMEENKEKSDQSEYGLTYADLERLKQTIPTITSATPMREFRKTVRHLEKKMDVRIATITPDYLDQNKVTVSPGGRGIEQSDQDQLNNVAVIGSAVAEQLYPGMNPVGRNIVVQAFNRNFPMQVVGIIEPKTVAGNSGDGGTDFNKVVFIPFEFDRIRIGKEIINVTRNSESIEKIEISQITLSIVSLEEVPRSAAAIRSMIEQFHPRKDVQILVPLDLLRKAEETQRLFTLILAAIASISLIVGGIGIMNIMLATVTERTREIGIRRALGAKQRDIALQFLVETMVLSCGGGVIGLALGIGGAYALQWISIPTKVEVWSVFVALGVSIFVGLLSGLYPARRAARLDPIEALRHS
jgi:putative ABC transport system permease protein